MAADPVVAIPLPVAQRLVSLAFGYEGLVKEQDGQLAKDEADALAQAASSVILAERLDNREASIVPAIPRGAVMLLRTDAELEPPDLDRITDDMVRVAGHREFTLLVVDANAELSALDEEGMRLAGWSRSPQAIIRQENTASGAPRRTLGRDGS